MKSSLKKELGLIDIFCVATGAMISSGLFILPGLAFAKAGPAVVISYLIAGVICIPTLFSSAELITAMPRAGGDYFYIMRGFGPLFGTIAGFSTWFSLSFKGAFALIGMGTYLSLFTNLSMNMIALICGVFFIVLNLTGVKEASKFQIGLVVGLLAVLITYSFWGSFTVKPAQFVPFFSSGYGAIFSTASFVFISYGGLVKVAALAEETRSPERNLPLGLILSLVVTSILYTAVIFVTVGNLDPSALKVSLTPISDGAAIFGGRAMQVIVGIGAFLAFVSTANSALMTASRYPLGMSRDKVLPGLFKKLSRRANVPYVAVLFTGSFMIAILLFLKIELLVKVASSLLLLLFTFSNLTLILFRESRIHSYQPKFRSPFYPHVQILGILGGIFLLIEMGAFIVFLTMIFVLLGFTWYKVYVEKRVSKDSALIYLLERLVARDTELTSDNLLVELRDVVMERDEMMEDRFHHLMEKSAVLDIEEPVKADDFFRKISNIIGAELKLSPERLFKQFMKREKESSTVIRKGLAIPHIVADIEGFNIMLVRARSGVIFPDDQIAHIIFIILGPTTERNMHLKVLAAIAQITENPGFDEKWMSATNEDELKNIVLLAERRRG